MGGLCEWFRAYRLACLSAHLRQIIAKCCQRCNAAIGGFEVPFLSHAYLPTSGKLLPNVASAAMLQLVALRCHFSRMLICPPQANYCQMLPALQCCNWWL